MKLALVGDIGGTNARFALWKNQQLESVQVLATADFPSPIDAISFYLNGLGLAPGAIGSVCLSVAGPVSGDEFKFTNTGDAPLVISSVQASCGCTVAEYSKEPIAPGAQGFVKATYNAAKVGVFTKSVTVNANAENNVVQLVIKGEVVK